MKHMTITLLAMIFAMGMPISSDAMSHKDPNTHKGHDMSHDPAKEMSHDKHAGHDMTGQDDSFVEIGKDTQDGVVATVKVKTYDEKTLASMQKMGMDATHHVMVFFADEKSGNDIADGQVALKMKDKEAKAVKMMQMGTGFGVDVSLKEGMHTFEIGTKLEDGKKRQFSIMFHNM